MRLLARVSMTCFITTAAIGRALPLPLKTAGLLVCVQLIGRVKCGRIWVVLHGHNLILPPAFPSSNPFATQGKQSDAGDEQTTFTGRRKGQSVVALLAACALNSYPMLLDLTDGVTHHVLQLTGTSLICWTNLMPQQAYYKQAEWLARPAAAQRQHTLESIPEDDAAPLKKMRLCRPEAAAMAQLSLELLDDLSPGKRVGRAYHVLDSIADVASPLAMPDAVAARYGNM